MQTLKFETTIDEKRTLSLTLPPDIRPGRADVIVMLDEEETRVPMKQPSDEIFEELMRFGNGRTLAGLSIREMAAEGRM